MHDPTRNENTLLHSVMDAVIATNSSLGIAAYTSSGQCVLANRAAATLVGGTGEQLLSQNFRKIQSWQDTGLVDWAERALALGTEQSADVSVTTTFGKQVSLRCRFVPFQFQDQQHLMLMYEDITSQKQTEAALIKSELRYHTLFENASEGIFLMQGIEFIDCNSRALEMFACTKDQIIGKTLLDFSPPCQPDGLSSQAKAQTFLEAAFDGRAQRFEWQHMRSDGTDVDAEVSLNRLDVSEREIVLALVRDITERKKAEKRLAEYQKRLRSLASELSLSEERLRRQVATWLHDHACQNLALVKLMLQNLHVALPAPHHETAGEITEMVDQVLLLLRDLTFDLSPPTLYMFGLEAALEELLEEQLRSKHEIEYDLVRDKKVAALSADIRVLLYQSVRELIINITKYAQATEVNVTIETERHDVRIIVQDNGIGFDTSQMDVSQSKGFGLFNINERLRHAGGQFQVESQPGLGSRFTLVAPLELTAEADKPPEL